MVQTEDNLHHDAKLHCHMLYDLIL